MKRTIEINDTLQETIDALTSDVTDLLTSWCDDNKPEDCPDLYNDLDYSGSVHELIDGAVPIYYSEIDGLYYLYGDEFEQAYRDAGIGDGTEDNHKQVAIYCYLEQQVADWWNDNAEQIFDDWNEAKDDE